MQTRIAQVMLLVGALGLTACDQEVTPTAAADGDPQFGLLSDGFETSEPLQAAFGPGVAGTMKALVTVDDALPGGNDFAGTPDGIGIWGGQRFLNLMVNHELSVGQGGSRVSRFLIDTHELLVLSHEYVVDGSEGYDRLCSAEWVAAEDGFPGGYFFTGQEVGEGVQLAIDEQGRVTEMPHLGLFAHENQVSVPGFPGSVVVLNFDDTGTSGSSPADDPEDGGSSELYMYVARNSRDVLNGRGQLYVFASDEEPNGSGLVAGQSIEGHWIAVPEDVATVPGALNTWVDDDAHQAFSFARLEDGFYDKRPGAGPAAFFYDTGDGDLASGGQEWDPWGSIYRVTWDDPGDPAGAATLTLMARSDGPATGWASPDNGDMNAEGEIMLQEDPANGPWEREPRIWRFQLSGDQIGAAERVVDLVNPYAGDPEDVWGWESSGIVDASEWFGPGAWIFDTQAHSIDATTSGGDLGQIIYMKIDD